MFLESLSKTNFCERGTCYFLTNIPSSIFIPRFFCGTIFFNPRFFVRLVKTKNIYLNELIVCYKFVVLKFISICKCGSFFSLNFIYKSFVIQFQFMFTKPRYSKNSFPEAKRNKSRGSG